MENEFCKISEGKVVFIGGKNLLPVPVGWRDQIMRVLHRRLIGSTDRANSVVFLTKKEIDIRVMGLEATESRAINGSLEVRVEGNLAELVTLAHIHYRVYWQGNKTVVHWGLYPTVKRREP